MKNIVPSARCRCIAPLSVRQTCPTDSSTSGNLSLEELTLIIFRSGGAAPRKRTLSPPLFPGAADGKSGPT